MYIGYMYEYIRHIMIIHIQVEICILLETTNLNYKAPPTGSRLNNWYLTEQVCIVII
jgi:hypothetical protein